MTDTVVIHIRDRQPGDVYIGRAGHGEDGYFGNPFVPGRHFCPVCNLRHLTAQATLPCYRLHFNNRVMTDPVFRKKIAELRGKRLVCFCKPKPCHGDTIVEWLASGQ